MPAMTRNSSRSAADSGARPTTMHVRGLLDQFRAVDQQMPERAFAFVLGAGASRSSGIKTAGEFARDWIDELFRRHPLHEQLERRDFERSSHLGVEGFDPSDPAASYSRIYHKRFGDDPAAGYAHLEHAMRGAEPSFGYSVLARLLSETAHKVVVTTNFDNLVADALGLYAREFPLVCGHESLAGFVRARPRRPLVVKIHHDLLLAPKSDPHEIAELPQAFQRALSELFSTYTPIFLGYGGNDGSLMGFLEALPPASVPGGLYWCYRDADGEPREQIQRVVARQRGALVAIAGFDEFMALLAEQLGYELRDQWVLQQAQDRAARLVEQFTRLRESLAPRPRATPPPATAIGDSEWPAHAPRKPSTERGSKLRSKPSSKQRPAKSAEASVESAELSRASKQADLAALAPHVELPVLPKLPASPALPLAAALDPLRSALESISQRVHGARSWWQWRDAAEAAHEPEQREALYREGLAKLPNDPWMNDAYARFLGRDPQRRERAEEFHQRALELAPHSAGLHGNYANLLARIEGREADARREYETALAQDPNDVRRLANRIGFELAVDGLPHNEVEERLRDVRERLAGQPPRALMLEVEFYRLAHGSSGERRRALDALRSLLKLGLRSPHWDFTRNIARARNARHPDGEWLQELAKVINDRAPLAELDAWPAWRESMATESA